MQIISIYYSFFSIYFKYKIEELFIYFPVAVLECYMEVRSLSDEAEPSAIVIQRDKTLRNCWTLRPMLNSFCYITDFDPFKCLQDTYKFVLHSDKRTTVLDSEHANHRWFGGGATVA